MSAKAEAHLDLAVPGLMLDLGRVVSESRSGVRRRSTGVADHVDKVGALEERVLAMVKADRAARKAVGIRDGGQDAAEQGVRLRAFALLAYRMLHEPQPSTPDMAEIAAAASDPRCPPGEAVLAARHALGRMVAERLLEALPDGRSPFNPRLAPSQRGLRWLGGGRASLAVLSPRKLAALLSGARQEGGDGEDVLLPDPLPARAIRDRIATRIVGLDGGQLDVVSSRLAMHMVRSKMLAAGEDPGRTPDGLRPTPVLLSRSVREGAVYAATMLMRLVGVHDVREVAREHVDRYLRHRGEDHRASAIHILWNMRPLFRHLAAAGEIAEDPLEGLGQQKSRVDGDYVPADQVAKLADLATLDAGSFADVRGRLLAFALCYDYGLRVGEAARLRTDDVRMGEFVELSVRGEIQKGSGKPAVTLRNLFPESRRLFELYLAMRPGAVPGPLLASKSGKALLLSGCRNAVKRISRDLDIKTHGGRIPPPHRYRHSLGTLNVGELGMRLSPYYLMRRYRHNDLRITTEVYVTHNPLLDEAQHVAIVNAANGNGHAAGADPQPRSMATDIRVPEQEATARIRSLGVNWRSLQDYAIEERAAVERGGRYYYSESFLDRLCGEWMTKKEAMRLMGITSRTAYLNRVRNHGIGTLVIGHASLARSTDVVRSLRRQGE